MLWRRCSTLPAEGVWGDETAQKGYAAASVYEYRCQAEVESEDDDEEEVPETGLAARANCLEFVEGYRASSRSAEDCVCTVDRVSASTEGRVSAEDRVFTVVDIDDMGGIASSRFTVASGIDDANGIDDGLDIVNIILVANVFELVDVELVAIELVA